MIDRRGEGGEFDVSASELQTLYRQGGGDEPAPDLDRRIIAAAHADLRAGARQGARRANWLTRWLPATSAIAVTLLGVSLAWRVAEDDTRELRGEPAMPERGSAAAPALAPGHDRPAPAAPASPATSEQRRSAAEAAGTHAGQPGAKANAVAAPQPGPARAPAAASAPAPLAPASGTLGQQRRDKRHAEEPLVETTAAPLAQRETAGAPTGAQRDSAAIPTDTRDNTARPTDTQRDSVAIPTDVQRDSAAKPAEAQAWIEQIRALRAAGRDVEADQSLARFRERYPAFNLPGDLAPIK